MIPNLFRKQKIPKKIPKGMQKIVEKLNKCKSKGECLRKAYDELNKTHHGAVCGVWKNFPSLFYRDINRTWNRKSLACTSLSFLLRVLLVKSRHFREKDIRQRIALGVLFCPHTFLSVNTGKKWVDVDAWGPTIGIPFGEYVTGMRWLKSIFRR